MKLTTEPDEQPDQQMPDQPQQQQPDLQQQDKPDQPQQQPDLEQQHIIFLFALKCSNLCRCLK